MIQVATWLGLTVMILAAVALFCAVQMMIVSVMFGGDPDKSWLELFIATAIMAMVVWIPLSLGWAVTSVTQNTETVKAAVEVGGSWI